MNLGLLQRWQDNLIHIEKTEVQFPLCQFGTIFEAWALSKGGNVQLLNIYLVWKIWHLPSDGGGGEVLGHATELANNLLHALLATHHGAVHVLDTLGKVVDRVGLCREIQQTFE